MCSEMCRYSLTSRQKAEYVSSSPEGSHSCTLISFVAWFPFLRRRICIADRGEESSVSLSGDGVYTLPACWSAHLPFDGLSAVIAAFVPTRARSFSKAPFVQPSRLSHLHSVIVNKGTLPQGVRATCSFDGLVLFFSLSCSSRLRTTERSPWDAVYRTKA